MKSKLKSRSPKNIDVKKVALTSVIATVTAVVTIVIILIIGIFVYNSHKDSKEKSIREAQLEQEKSGIARLNALDDKISQIKASTVRYEIDAQNRLREIEKEQKDWSEISDSTPGTSITRIFLVSDVKLYGGWFNGREGQLRSWKLNRLMQDNFTVGYTSNELGNYIYSRTQKGISNQALMITMKLHESGDGWIITNADSISDRFNDIHTKYRNEIDSLRE